MAWLWQVGGGVSRVGRAVLFLDYKAPTTPHVERAYGVGRDDDLGQLLFIGPAVVDQRHFDGPAGVGIDFNFSCHVFCLWLVGRGLSPRCGKPHTPRLLLEPTASLDSARRPTHVM